ncbi:MAG: flagellar motor protein MotB [Hydrogenovibrio sp.]|nr:flagellar motor protein MotB [Hydrogenovibrio sp.]
MARKAKDCPDWLATFADLMSLLMAVFVLLFSMSTIDAKKYEQLVESLTGALGYGEGLSATQTRYFEQSKTDKNISSLSQQQALIQELKPLYESLIKTYAKDGQGKSKIDVRMDLKHQQIKVSLPEIISFSPGKADLKAESLPELRKLKPFIHDGIRVRAVGHTDKRAVTGGRFRSNWELSSARAAAVVQQMVADKIVKPSQIEAIGVAATQPVNNDETEEGFAKNRRVEILLIPDLPKQLNQLKMDRTK